MLMCDFIIRLKSSDEMGTPGPVDPSQTHKHTHTQTMTKIKVKTMTITTNMTKFLAQTLTKGVQNYVVRTV